MSLFSTSLCSETYLDEIVEAEEEEEGSESSSSSCQAEEPKRQQESSSSPLSTSEKNNTSDEEFIISSIDTGKSSSAYTYKDFIISSIDTKFSDKSDNDDMMDETGDSSVGVVTTPDLMQKLDSLIEASDLEMNFLNRSSSSFLKAIESSSSSSSKYSPDFFDESTGLGRRERVNHTRSFVSSSSQKSLLSPPSSEESMGVKEQVRELDALVMEWTKAAATTTATSKTRAQQKQQHSQTKPRKLVFPDHPNSPLCRMADTPTTFRRFDDDDDDEDDGDDEISDTDNDNHIVAKSFLSMNTPLFEETERCKKKKFDDHDDDDDDDDAETSPQPQQQVQQSNKEEASFRDVLQPWQQHRTPFLSNQPLHVVGPYQNHPESSTAAAASSPFTSPLVCSSSCNNNNDDNDTSSIMVPTAALVDQKSQSLKSVQDSDNIDVKSWRRQQQTQEQTAAGLLPPSSVLCSSCTSSGGSGHRRDDKQRKKSPLLCDEEMEIEVAMTSSTSTDDASLEEAQTPGGIKKRVTYSDRISPLQTTPCNEKNDDVNENQRHILEYSQCKLLHLDGILFYLIQVQVLLAQVFGALLSYFLHVMAPPSTTTSPSPQPHHWHLHFVGIGLAFGSAIFPSFVMSGVLFRIRLSATMICLWMLRWTCFSILTIHDRGGVDARLTEQLASMQGIAEYWCLVAVWSLVTLLPHSLGTTSRHPGRVWSTIIGISTFLVGLAIESVADWQKWNFYNNADDHSTQSFCSTGLWSIVQYPNYVGEVLVWLGIAVLHAPALVEPPTQDAGFVRRVWNLRRVFLAFSSPLAVTTLLAAQTPGSFGNARDLTYSKHGYLLNPGCTNYVDKTPLLLPWSYYKESSPFWSELLTSIQRAFDGEFGSVQPIKPDDAQEELSSRGEKGAEGIQSSREDGVRQVDKETSPALPSTLTIETNVKGLSIQPLMASDQTSIPKEEVPFNSLKVINAASPDDAAKLSVAQDQFEQESDDVLSSPDDANLQVEVPTEELTSTLQAETERSSEEVTEARDQAISTMNRVLEATNTVDDNCIRNGLLDQTETMRDEEYVPEMAVSEPVIDEPPEIAMLSDFYGDSTAELMRVIDVVQSAMNMDVKDNTIAEGNVVANAWSDRNDVLHPLKAEADQSPTMQDRTYATGKVAPKSYVDEPPEAAKQFEYNDLSSDSICEGRGEQFLQIENVVTPTEISETNKGNLDKSETDELVLFLQIAGKAFDEELQPIATNSEEQYVDISQDTAAENVPNHPSFGATVQGYVVQEPDFFLQKDESGQERTQNEPKASVPDTPKIAPHSARLAYAWDTSRSDTPSDMTWKIAASHSFENDKGPHRVAERSKLLGPASGTAQALHTRSPFETNRLQVKDSTPWQPRPPPLYHEVNVTNILSMLQQIAVDTEEFFIERLDRMKCAAKSPPADHKVNMTRITTILRQLTVISEDPLDKIKSGKFSEPARLGPPPEEYKFNMMLSKSIPPVQKTLVGREECCIGPLDKIKRAFCNHLKRLFHHSSGKTFPLTELWQVDDDKLAERLVYSRKPS